MKTLIRRSSARDELPHGGILGHDDVRGRDGFVLVEAPDVQLVDGLDAGDLYGGKGRLVFLIPSFHSSTFPGEREVFMGFL